MGRSVGTGVVSTHHEPLKKGLPTVVHERADDAQAKPHGATDGVAQRHSNFSEFSETVGLSRLPYPRLTSAVERGQALLFTADARPRRCGWCRSAGDVAGGAQWLWGSNGRLCEISLWDRLRVRGYDWVGCTGRGEARGSRELCACAGGYCTDKCMQLDLQSLIEHTRVVILWTTSRPRESLLFVFRWRRFAVSNSLRRAASAAR